MFIIKDKKNGYWLEIDRVVHDMDIVTVIEPVYNYKSATAFESVEAVEHILEQIKSEGNYDIANYTTENVEELKQEEEKSKEQEQKEQE